MFSQKMKSRAVDTWLLWQLSGGRRHLTDASNASRTQLFDIHLGRWDPALLQALPKAEAGPTELWDMFQALAAVPLLLLWAQESKVLSAATVLEMRRRKPDLELLSLPGLEHAPWLGLPAAVARIDAFIDRLG